MNATKWVVWLGRYNLLGATLAILVGGFLRFGGF